MRVALTDIPAAGRLVRLDSHTEWAATAARDAVDGAVRVLSGELRLTRGDADTIHVTGQVHVDADRSCDRCGEAVTLTLDASVDLAYAPVVAGDDAGDETELHQDELDLGWYDGGGIEVAAVLCEALALALPSRTLCADVAACDARTNALLESNRTETSPFAVLRGLVNPR